MLNATCAVPVGCSHLRINYNRGITGTLPASVSLLTKLRSFETRANSLTGSLPNGMSGLIMLQELLADGNQLTGSIPPLDRLTDLRYVGVTLTRA